MRLITGIDRRSSAAPVAAKYAYLFRVDDIRDWFPPQPGSVQLEYMPRIKDGATAYQLYITSSTAENSYSRVGDLDRGGFITRFMGTHPGSMLSTLEFADNMMQESFIIMIPRCDGKTIVLGTPDNPMVFTSSHKQDKSGQKFNFNFEQLIDSEETYMIGNFDPTEESDFQYFDKYFDKYFE